MKSNLILLCILFVGAKSELHKLDADDNYRRFRDCGKLSDESYKVPGVSFVKGGNDGDVSTGALLTPRHLIFHTNTYFYNGNQFHVPYYAYFSNGCEDRKLSKVSVDEDKKNEMLKKVDIGVISKEIDENGKYFYGNCTSRNGFLIFVLQSPVEYGTKYTCFPDKELYSNFKSMNATFMPKKGSNHNPYQPISGVVKTCPDSDKELCWESFEHHEIFDSEYFKEIRNLVGVSVFTENEKSTFVGFAYKKVDNLFYIQDLRDDIDQFCEQLGICEYIPTTTITTTTPSTTTITTTTPPPPPPTTPHIPALLLDESLEDFEMPYIPKKKKSSNTILFLDFVMLWMVGMELIFAV